MHSPFHPCLFDPALGGGGGEKQRRKIEEREKEDGEGEGQEAREEVTESRKRQVLRLRNDECRGSALIDPIKTCNKPLFVVILDLHEYYK